MTAGCRAGRSRCHTLLAQVEPLLEQTAESLSRQAYFLELWPLDAKDLDRLVHAAVAAQVALGFAQRPQPTHLRTRLGRASDV